MIEDNDIESPYCPVCGACGEEGCCPPQRCTHKQGCLYPYYSNSLWIRITRSFWRLHLKYRIWRFQFRLERRLKRNED